MKDLPADPANAAMALHPAYVPLPGLEAGWLDWLGWAAQTGGRIFAMDATQYLLAAGLTVLVLWVFLRRRLAHRRIDPAYPEARHLRREIAFSLSTVAVFALIGIGLTFAVLSGWTRLYLDVADYGWVYGLASVAGLVLLHDTYFYWTHRLMHHRLLFKRFHRLHHRSHNPSPWAAYAFAPTEAVVEAGFLPLMVFLVPLHPLALLAFVVHQIFRNALGHSGFEVFPASWQQHWALRWVNTNTHHHLHHAKGGGNYGLYFLWWDRLMGTEHPATAATFMRASGGPRTVTAPGAPAPAGAASAGAAAAAPAASSP